jgi:hypothetical protein
METVNRLVRPQSASDLLSLDPRELVMGYVQMYYIDRFFYHFDQRLTTFR